MTAITRCANLSVSRDFGISKVGFVNCDIRGEYPIHHIIHNLSSLHLSTVVTTHRNRIQICHDSIVEVKVFLLSAPRRDVTSGPAPGGRGGT